MSWRTATLRQIAPPSTAETKFSSNDRVWSLSLDKIESGTGAVLEKRYVQADEAGSSTFHFDTDNVLYSKLRPYLNKVVLPDEPGIATTELIPLRPNKDVVDARYLAHYLRSHGFVSQASNQVAGANLPRVAMNWFWQHEVPLPTLSEQRRIVELLDQADALRRLRREADAKAARILPTLFMKMFGDPATNPMRWPSCTLGDVLLSADYGSSTRASDEGKGLPLIRMSNVGYDGSLLLDSLKYVELNEAEAEKYRLHADDILFNRTNSLDLVGKTGIWDGGLDAVVASYFIRMRVDRSKLEPTFLWAFMNSRFMKRVLRATARGAIGQANINTNELRAFPLYVPPLTLQKEFVNRACAIKQVLPALAIVSDLDEMFKVLLQKAFAGELTDRWRKARTPDLLLEMQQQAKDLNVPRPKESAA